MKAEREIVKYIQMKSFKEEFDSLRLSKQQPSKKGTTRRSNSLKKLDPILDDGLVDAVILPKKTHVSNLIISHYHQLLYDNDAILPNKVMRTRKI